MKKNILFILFTALIFITFSSFKENVVSINIMKQRAPTIHVNLNLGREPYCNNIYGICRIICDPNGGKVLPYPRAGGFASYENGILTIEMMENEMGDQLIHEFTTFHFLPLDVALDLDGETVKSLRAPSGSHIEIGRYPILKIEGGYRISLSIK